MLCPSVPAWTDASFSSLDRTVNSSVSYECNDGFAFKDKEKIKHTSCSSKGEWIPEIYDCLCKCYHYLDFTLRYYIITMYVCEHGSIIMTGEIASLDQMYRLSYRLFLFFSSSAWH